MFVTEDQIQEEIDGMVEYARYLYDLFGVSRERRALDATREASSARTSSGTARKRRSRPRSKRHEMDYVDQPGGRNLLRPEDRPAHDGLLGRSWQMGTIQLDYQMPRGSGSRTSGPTTRSTDPVVIHRALLGSLERFTES